MDIRSVQSKLFGRFRVQQQQEAEILIFHSPNSSKVNSTIKEVCFITNCLNLMENNLDLNAQVTASDSEPTG